jgi:proteasome lid subunit RPN8/RPN11
MDAPVVLTKAERMALVAHAEATAPWECCGLIVVHRGERRVLRGTNVQDDLHGVDPARYPQDGRSAYTLAAEQQRELARWHGRGARLAVIYHSHVDTTADFSEADRQRALVDGQPAYPEAAHVVLGVRWGLVAEIKAFLWARGDFIERALVITQAVA